MTCFIVAEIGVKQCSKCKNIYPATSDFFHKSHNRKDGLKEQCKKCRIEYQHEYYQKNIFSILEKEKIQREKTKEHLREYFKNYYLKNKEEKKKYAQEYRKTHQGKYKIYLQQYYKANKEKRGPYRRAYDRIRRKNPKIALSLRIANLIRKSLSGNKNNKHWEDLVGYSLQNLKKRLSKTMPSGYTWQDFLDGKLHIDHIVPISVFNFSSPNHIDFKRCWELKNLRLLPAKENISKGSKIHNSFQPSLRIALCQQ